MEIPILLETSDFLVINKPSGIMVHADGRSFVKTTEGHGKSDKETLVDWILVTHPDIAGVGEPMVVDGKTIDRPGIVHRLDEETSGVMVIAKTPEAFVHLKMQFHDRLAKKEYHAFVWGHFKQTSGVVDEPMGRNKTDFRRWHAGRGMRGEVREAMTSWSVVAQFLDEEQNQFSFVQLFPKTGRTHQLRVHMKFLQRPIVGDHLYAPTKPDALGFARVALHARTLSFVAPNGEQVAVTAPYPEDFEGALAKYGVS